MNHGTSSTLSAATVYSFADRPNAPYQHLIARSWPRYICEAPSASPEHDPDWAGLARNWPIFQFGIWEGGALIASGNTCPLSWRGALDALPTEGWDWALHQAVLDMNAGRAPTVLVGVSATIAPEARGRKISSAILARMCQIARDAGLNAVIIPVRPSWKERYPLIPMADYARWTRPDGLPFDPWLRVHARAGGRLLHVCERSMMIGGRAEHWADWLDLPIHGDGDYTAPGLLVPLRVRGGQGLYVEPNMWVVHSV